MPPLPRPPLKPQLIFTGRKRSTTSLLTWVILILSVAIIVVACFLIFTLIQLS